MNPRAKKEAPGELAGPRGASSQDAVNYSTHEAKYTAPQNANISVNSAEEIRRLHDQLGDFLSAAWVSRELTSSAKASLLVICAASHSPAGCFTGSAGRLAKEIGKSRNCAQAALRALQEAGLVVKLPGVVVDVHNNEYVPRYISTDMPTEHIDRLAAACIQTPSFGGDCHVI